MPTTADDLNRSIGRIEGKIDAFIEQMKVHDNRSTGMEVRLRSVENKQYYMAGAGGIVGAILGALGLHIKW